MQVRQAVIGFLATVGAVAIVGVAGFGLYGAVVKPAMPVSITFERRPATLFRPDLGYVARIANTSGRYLIVNADAENTTLQQSMKSPLELPPEADAANPASFGPDQRWKFVSGETLTLTHEDYQPLRVVVP